MAFTAKLAKFSMTFGLGAAVAFAQAAGAPAAAQGKTEAHGQGAHTADHGMTSYKGAGLMVGKEDHDFLVKAAQDGTAEIEATRLAQEKGSSNEVKEFARKLEQDHTKANEQLKQLAMQKNVELPSDAGKSAAGLEKIRNLSGDKFDKEFMKMQVKHHKKDVSAFQKQTERSMDSDVKAFVTATLPTLQDHLRQAEQLQGSTRGRAMETKADTATETKPDTKTDTTKPAEPAAPTAPAK